MRELIIPWMGLTPAQNVAFKFCIFVGGMLLVVLIGDIIFRRIDNNAKK